MLLLDSQQAFVERNRRRKGRVRLDAGRQGDEQVALGEDRNQEGNPQA